MTREKEIWECVPNYEEFYKVSSWGRFWGLRRDMEMSLSLHRGYLKINLRNGFGENKTFRAHRLVALVFCDNPEDKPEVNHDDFDKENNYYKNLMWSTGKENREHYQRNNPSSANSDVPVIRVCSCGGTIDYDNLSIAGRDNGLDSNSISLACRGYLKRCGGFEWKFKE